MPISGWSLKMPLPELPAGWALYDVAIELRQPMEGFEHSVMGIGKTFEDALERCIAKIEGRPATNGEYEA